MATSLDHARSGRTQLGASDAFRYAPSALSLSVQLFIKMTKVPNENNLADAIQIAARNAISDLFSKHNERFYYCSLITTGEGHRPYLTAWSWEALEAAIQNSEDPKEEEGYLKWSPVDSPYSIYGDHHFKPLEELFSLRPLINHEMPDEERECEYNLRLRAMETAMKRLDSEGLFGKGENRNKIFINVEVMPPDETNTARALRLNSNEALKDWLIEASELI